MDQPVIDVGNVSEDQRVIASDGGMLVQFFGGFVKFFSTATELEDQAKALAERSQTFTLPKTAEQDAALVRFVQEANASRKLIVSHWEITSAFSKLHKRLVAVRERGVLYADTAAQRAQRLHNDYLAAEARRVREENEAREREAEAKARIEREAELRRLEAAAVEAEEVSSTLSPREVAFVRYFREGKTGKQAAQLAGYKDPIGQAARLQTSEKIRAAIKAADDADAIRRQQAAKAAQPLNVVQPERAVANVIKTGTERTYKGAELTDEKALIAAILEGKLGIPIDLLTINPSKLNQYGRDLGVLVNRWPGVRFTENKKTI